MHTSSQDVALLFELKRSARHWHSHRERLALHSAISAFLEIMGSYFFQLCPPSSRFVQDKPPEAEIRFPTCIICFERPVSTACLPCGHAVMCVECATRLPRQYHRNTVRQPRCPVCRSNSTIHNIVHLKYLDEAPPCIVDNADCLALHRSVTDAAEAALDNAENITSQLLEALQSTRALADHSQSHRLSQFEDLFERFEKLERHLPVSKTCVECGLQVSLPSSAASTPPLSPSSSLIVSTESEEFRLNDKETALAQ